MTTEQIEQTAKQQSTRLTLGGQLTAELVPGPGAGDVSLRIIDNQPGTTGELIASVTVRKLADFFRWGDGRKRDAKAMEVGVFHNPRRVNAVRTVVADAADAGAAGLIRDFGDVPSGEGEGTDNGYCRVGSARRETWPSLPGPAWPV